jgi:hypothetical protein
MKVGDFVVERCTLGEYARGCSVSIPAAELRKGFHMGIGSGRTMSRQSKASGAACGGV